MLSLVTVDISPENRKSSKKPEISELAVGRSKVLHSRLRLPLDMSERQVKRRAEALLTAMADMGGDELIAPSWLEKGSAFYGLRPSDDLRIIRARAAQAAMDGLKGRGPAYVKVYARMASKDVAQCALTLAENCRYVAVAGGGWASSMRRRLMSDYGAAAPPEGFGDFKMAVVFDGGFEYGGEDMVLDLTRGELDCPNMFRPVIESCFELAAPEGGFFDKSRMLAALFVRGGLEKEDIKACCPVIP